MKGAVVITVSDSRTRGEREDLSGPAVAQALERAGFGIPERCSVADEQVAIEAELRAAARRSLLVVTTGGTGVASRDVTPEATAAVCERIIPGIGERMRSAGSEETPLSYLSRGVSGTLGRSLIVNLPGSPQGAVTSFNAVVPLIRHALALLDGHGGLHPEPHSVGADPREGRTP